jgi:hypothetical protein
VLTIGDLELGLAEAGITAVEEDIQSGGTARGVTWRGVKP